MYAIVEIAGKQFKAEAGRKLYVPRLQADPEAKLTFERVLLADSGDGVTVGTPTIEGATVEATVIDHVKGDKVLVFKKKRRKRYRVKRGHRQTYTQIEITGLDFGNGQTAAPKKKEEEPAQPAAEQEEPVVPNEPVIDDENASEEAEEVTAPVSEPDAEQPEATDEADTDEEAEKNA